MSYPGKKATDDDDVEQLLRAAHDDVLLKLDVNSHIARGSASAAMDLDLDRRFQALKRPQKPTKVGDSTKIVASKTDSGGDKVAGAAAAEEDDLFARFSALKNSLPSHNKRESTSGFSGDQEAKEEESEDEVEKVIQWAMDAARLDPSPPSDDDGNESDDADDTDDDNDEDIEGKKGRKRVNKK